MTMPEAIRVIVPSDAPCVVCGSVRPPAAVAHADPFDTSRCARAFYGCSLDPKTERPPRKLAA
jgi:hypothetical protein